MELHPASYYVHALKRVVPASVHAADPARLLWMPVHLGVVVLGTLAIASRAVPWPLIPILSIVIGLSFAGLMFLGHELLHGAIVRGRWNWLRPILGWVCFAPFAVSQKLWVVWHNRIHHANTNKFGADPDMYPTLEAYRADPVTRWTTDRFALGGRRKSGLVSLPFGFVGQSKAMLVESRSRLHMTNRELAITIVETAIAVAMWTAVGILIGLVPFVFAYVIPVLVGDVVVMAFILTNHCLSPATAINDPLVNCLSVSAPRFLEWLTLDFGYHVEHHLFPSASGRHARVVRDALLHTWPERYQTMPVLDALAMLYRTGRVYKDATTLCDPASGGEWPTLAPRSLAHETIRIALAG